VGEAVKYRSRSKILIAGPTGTGTTFLIGLLHRLGFDTGFSDEEVTAVVMGRGKGLEYTRGGATMRPWRAAKRRGKDISPEVIKQPIQDHGDDGGTKVIGDVLDTVEENGWIVQHLFATVRNLTAVVDSIERRMKTGDQVMFTVRGAKDKRRRELLAAEGFYKLACKLAVREHPYTLIEFPTSAEDPEYCFRKLNPILNPLLLSFEDFKKIHAETARRDMVHVK
jgi:hypothetical protein